MRPVTLRRISQHPPVTSKLGLSSRLALPAHFHRQPGFLMCGLLISIMHLPTTLPETKKKKKEEEEEEEEEEETHTCALEIIFCPTF